MKTISLSSLGLAFLVTQLTNQCPTVQAFASKGGSGGGFSTFLKNPFSNPAAPEAELTAEEKSKLILDGLQMESSYEPKKFQVDPKRSSDIATAAMPVSKLQE